MQIAPATHFTSVPRGLAWIEIDAALGASLWLQGMQKGALRDQDGHEVVCVHIIAKAGARPAPRYVKRWKGANGKWRYAYASHEGGGIHNAAHFTEGARFAHGDGHYEIGKDGTATHSHTGHQIGVGELGAHLEAHHGADIAAHKKGVLDRFIEQIGEASTPKHKAALEKKAAAYGYTKPKAEPAASKKPAKVAQKDGSTKVDRLTDDEYADTHDELSRLTQELNPGGLQQGPKGSARDALVAKINAARAKLGLKPHSDDPYADRSGEQAARQHAMGIRERQRAAKAEAKTPEPTAKKDDAQPSEADMFSGGAWGKTDAPKAEPIAQKGDDAQGPDRMEHSPKSSHIKHVEWIADNPKSNKGTLRVHFKTGHVHDHYDRHRDDFTGMKDAASAGEFYNDRIKGIGESKTVREASPQQKKEARIEATEKRREIAETKRQSAVANYMAKNDPDSVVKTERGPFPKGEEAKPPAAKPAPEIAAKPEKKAVTMTGTNLHALHAHFGDKDEAPNRAEGGRAAHIKRAVDAGLVEAAPDRKTLRLTESGKAVMKTQRERAAEADADKARIEKQRDAEKSTPKSFGPISAANDTPAPSAAKAPAEPVAERTGDEHYAAAQSTYGLSDRDMQIVKRRSQDAVKGHTQSDAHDQAKAAVRDAVHRHIFQDRNMSPSQAAKWMREREAKAVTPVPAKEAPQPAAAKAPEPKAEAAAKPATAAKAPAVSQDERDAQNAKHRANVQATKKYLDGAIKRAKTKPSGEKDRDVARARASYERASKEWNDWQEGIPEPSGEDDRTGPLDNKDNHSTVKSYRKDEPGVKEPKVGRTVVHANDDEHLVHEDDMSSSNITTGRLARSEIIGVDKDRRKVKLRSEDGTEHEVDDHHLSRGVIEKSPADIESEEKQGRLFKGLSAILKALATPWVEIPEDLALSLVAKGKSHKYIKKVATGKTSKTGKPVYRYYYKVAADTHAAKHFHAGSAFADGKHGGHWHIHAKDGDKLHLKHDETGEDRHMTTGELSAMLHSTHNVGAVEEAQRAKAKAEVAAAKESGSAKHVEAAKKRAEAVGVKEQAPEPAQTESVASEPVTTRHAFMDDPGDDKHAPGSIYRNGKGGKVYVSLAMKSRKGNRSDEDHGNYVPSGKVENTVTAREATPEEVARYEEWAAGPAGRAPRPKANIHAPQATPSTANIAAHMPAIKALRDQIVAINTMPQFSMERADANHAITAAAKALAEEMGNTPEAAHVAATVDALKSHISGTTNADVSRLDAILAGRAPDAPVPAQEPESPHGKQVQSASEASKVVLSGKTFEAKDEIRKMGGRWDAANKVWVLPVKDTMRGRADLSADLHHLRKRGVSHTFHKGRSLDAFIAALARTH